MSSKNVEPLPSSIFGCSTLNDPITIKGEFLTRLYYRNKMSYWFISTISELHNSSCRGGFGTRHCAVRCARALISTHSTVGRSATATSLEYLSTRSLLSPTIINDICYSNDTWSQRWLFIPHHKAQWSPAWVLSQQSRTYHSKRLFCWRSRGASW